MKYNSVEIYLKGFEMHLHNLGGEFLINEETYVEKEELLKIAKQITDFVTESEKVVD